MRRRLSFILTLSAVLCAALCWSARADGGANGGAVSGATPQKAAPILEYALPSSTVYYQRQAESWFLDCAVTGACTVHFEVYADPDHTRLAASVRKKLRNGGLFRLPWSGGNGNRKLSEGTYWCRAYASGASREPFSFVLQVRGGKPPHRSLAPTESLLPSSMDDASVWEALTRPITVVNIKATAHQRLYAKPNPKSEVVGSVHGQSQGLEVLEVGKAYTLVRVWRHEDGEYVEGYVPTKKLKVIAPNDHYGLVIDKATQLMTVYEHGRRIGEIGVSTGLMDTDKLFRETRAGAFLTTDRVSPFESKGYRYDYAIRIDGGNLIHQVGWEPLDESGVISFERQLLELGGKASEGCVRVDCRTDSQSGLNAYWLWTHLEYGTKVLVLDDPVARQARLFELAARTGE